MTASGHLNDSTRRLEAVALVTERERRGDLFGVLDGQTSRGALAPAGVYVGNVQAIRIKRNADNRTLTIRRLTHRQFVLLSSFPSSSFPFTISGLVPPRRSLSFGFVWLWNLRSPQDSKTYRPHSLLPQPVFEVLDSRSLEPPRCQTQLPRRDILGGIDERPSRVPSGGPHLAQERVSWSMVSRLPGRRGSRAPFLHPSHSRSMAASQFYDSHTLSSGEHVLHMNVTHAEDDWPFVLDYILYVPLAPLLRPSSSSGAPSAQASFVKTSHTPAIVGGAVGGVVLLLAAVLYAYFGKTFLRCKHDLSTNAVRNAGSKKVDLLDDDCKFPPPSPLTPKSDTDADVESMSAYTFTEMRFRSRATSLSLNSEQHHTLVARGNRRSMSDLDCESAMSPPHSPPSTPSASTFSHGAGAATRSSTTFQSVLTPPSAAYRASHGPHITYRPATPSEASFSQSFQAGPDTGPNGSSTVARQSEKVQLLREQRQATFHADSGVRFKAGQTLPVDVQSPSANPRPPPPAPPLSEASTSTSAGLAQWKQQQQRKKRVSFGGSAISEVPPMYTPN